MTCDGMYADINWKDERMKDEKDKNKLTMLYSEYQNFKKTTVKYFRFSSEASSNMYGKQILQQRKTLTIYSTYFREGSVPGKELFHTSAGADLL